jgi:hypothetical protein
MGVRRACRRAYERQGGFALAAILVLLGFAVVSDTSLVLMSHASARPREWMLNHWLLLVLGLSFVAWNVLKSRGRGDPVAELGFVVAAYGLLLRFYVNFAIYGMAPTWGRFSLVEEVCRARELFLVATHRHGGLAAYVLGLLYVLLVSRATARGRGGSGGRGHSPAPAPRGRAPRAGAPPS